MATLSIGRRRADGKWPVTFIFEGAPNAFGGFYPSRRYNKLLDSVQFLDAIKKHGDEQQRAYFTPLRVGHAGVV